MTDLETALRATRRGIHVYGKDWRTLIVADPRYMRYVFHDEVVPVLQASSLAVELIQHATLTVRTEKGGIIRVLGVDDYMDALRLAGHMYTHIIWAHTPTKSTNECRGFINALLRSPTVPHEALRTDEVTF